MREQYRRCFSCDRADVVLRARTFYGRGRHETLYLCRACDERACAKTERLMGMTREDAGRVPWEELPAVPQPALN